VDQAKSNFISVITHELRTPVANVSFSLQLIDMYGMDNLLPEQKEQIKQISAGIKTTKAMVDNLITLAAFLNKQVELNLSEINSNEMIQLALTPLIPRAKEKEIMLHIDIIGDLLPVVGDSKHLENAIYQLIENAVKFTDSGGHVWVRSWTTSEEFFFDVKDSGPGVAPEKLPALWDEFNQMADPLRRTLEGLGLGLALVRYIVTAHGGKVWVESQEGKGSEFGFKLPLDGPKELPVREDDFLFAGDVPRPQGVY
jgi:signal transduction histidine kinase